MRTLVKSMCCVLLSFMLSATAFATKATTEFPKQMPAKGVSVFIFDPHRTTWAVYDENGNLIKTGHGSGGRNYCSDIHRRCHTPVGTFHVYAQEGRGCKSKIFPVGKGGAPMPYCNYFDGGFAVHGSYEVRSYNASHGCIRVYPTDAKWLQTILHPGSVVIVKPY
ncbi:MAG: L,D-transpeptidase [Legionellales bacterium]|nr:L,D-transpeptidase [Legionellales bacterium]